MPNSSNCRIRSLRQLHFTVLDALAHDAANDRGEVLRAAIEAAGQLA